MSAAHRVGMLTGPRPRHSAQFMLLLLASFGASAVVIRDDVPDPHYRMAASEFPALAGMPGESHGVLIAPKWVLTAAHLRRAIGRPFLSSWRLPTTSR